MTPALLALAVLVAAPRPKDPPRPPDYFPTTVGARWVYDIGGQEQVEVVTGVEEKGGATVVTVGYEGAGGKVRPMHTIAVRADGLYMTEEVGKPYDPPMCLLRFPVRAGRTWESESVRPDIGRVFSRREAGEVEEVDTPAGKFRAVPVTADLAIGAATTTSKSTYWYAPEVGLVKIGPRGGGDRVLKSFVARPPAKAADPGAAPDRTGKK